MGGLLILSSAAFATVLLADVRVLYVWIAVFVAISFGAVGLADDMLKLKRGRGQGISGRTKLGWSFFFAAVAAVVLFGPMHFDTHLTIPFAKNLHPDLHWWGYIPLRNFRHRGLLTCGELD